MGNYAHVPYAKIRKLLFELGQIDIGEGTLVATTRSRVELEQILGTEYRGVLSSDDFSVYNGYRAAAQQKCLAHLQFPFLLPLPLT